VPARRALPAQREFSSESVLRPAPAASSSGEVLGAADDSENSQMDETSVQSDDYDEITDTNVCLTDRYIDTDGENRDSDDDGAWEDEDEEAVTEIKDVDILPYRET
jgi:hypothetical protein